MSLAAKAAAFGSFELTVCVAPWPMGLLLSTYGGVGLPLGIICAGEPRGGAEMPLATAAAGDSPTSARVQLMAPFITGKMSAGYDSFSALRLEVWD